MSQLKPLEDAQSNGLNAKNLCKKSGGVLELDVFQSHSTMIQSLGQRHLLETNRSVALPQRALRLISPA